MRLTIVAGGQTGVDRAALDVAGELGLPRGGWCPAGGWAEDLPDPPGLLGCYPTLRPTPTADPARRTRWNVRDSDATLVLHHGDDRDSPGTRLTVAVARELGRPLLEVSCRPRDRQVSLPCLRSWLAALPPDSRLNVAGPRESEAPGVQTDAAALLRKALRSE